ncbi:MAG: 23S rRNA (pseudouridine(1915)-N(3))-methyltransferase RlmH [Ruminococcaceae bacterium]|nr:23S rRNA (pseudouridine(1915)-N(3))-methyltransferase RlmH [Oscillospiraceae bacterium]
MIRINVICSGKLKEKFWEQACAEYVKRIGGHADLKITELPEILPSSGVDAAAALRREAAAVEKAVPKGAKTIVLTPEGKQYSSEEFASLISSLASGGDSRLCFIIGSSNGISPELKASADMQISFSKMTFPHHLFRAMLLEQIYRAFMILGGRTYNK